MVILDVDVEDMDRTIQLAALVVQILEHGIEAAFLAGNHNIDYARLGTLEALVLTVIEARFARHPILKTLGKALDVKVAAQHVQ